MKKLSLLLILVFAGSAFAGFSIGFKMLDLPSYTGYSTGQGVQIFTSEVPMIRIGAAASPEFRVEGLIGYDKISYDDDSDVEYSASLFAIGGSAFYVIANPANTVFSLGGSLVYSKTSSETDNVDGPETSGLSIYPIMRVDFAIPGAERFAFFTEFGLRYQKTSTDIDGDDYHHSDFGFYGSKNILGGAYYSF